MFDDDIDDDVPEDITPFVGRSKEREVVKGWLGHSGRAVQLIGPPMVGKSALAEKISRELQSEMAEKDKTLRCYHMCVRDVETLSDLLACLGAGLGIEDTLTSEIALIKKFQTLVRNSPECRHLFVLLKCETVHQRPFYVQFVDIVKKVMEVSKKVFVIITTQKPFTISVVKQHDIKPLPDDDIVTLIRRWAPNIDIDIYKRAILKNCMGLPPLAIDAAHMLLKAKAAPYTAEEFDLLTSRENRSRRVHGDNLDTQASKKFMCLNDFLKERLVDISIFKGAFRVDDVLKIIGDSRLEAKRTLHEMVDTGLLEFQDGGERMRIQSCLQHYIREQHVKYDDTVRLRYVTLFVDVLKKADTELFIKPQQTVFGYLHDDWPNLREVLEQAIHCTENTYSTFLQVALSAENLLVKCFPGEAVVFYEAMMCSAWRFGTPTECAMQKWLLGMAMTIGKGTDLVKAMGLFQEAFPVLKQSDQPECLVSLLADMGLNYNRQGKNKESRHFYLQALEESGRCCDGRKLTNRIINIRCYLAIPMIFLECFDEAEKLLNETLEETDVCAPYHPAKPIMINSLGLIYERSGRSDDMALRYYSNSLAERRKYSEVAPGDLVVVLNNVAMQHSKRGNHAFALQLLSEAKEIRLKIDTINYHTALTCWNMSQVFARKGEERNALKEIKYALEVFKKCTRDHFVIVEVLLLAFHLAASLYRFDDAENYLLEALAMKDIFEERVPDSMHILSVLYHLVIIYQGYKRTCSPYLDMAIAEALRLEHRSRESGSLDKSLQCMDQYDALLRIRTRLDQNSLNDNCLEEHITEMMSFCIICEGFNSRNIDIIQMYVSLSTSVCDALRRADKLRGSRILVDAIEALKIASGVSDSPPESPEIPSGSSSFNMNGNQHRSSGVMAPHNAMPMYNRHPYTPAVADANNTVPEQGAYHFTTRQTLDVRQVYNPVPMNNGHPYTQAETVAGAYNTVPMQGGPHFTPPKMLDVHQVYNPMPMQRGHPLLQTQPIAESGVANPSRAMLWQMTETDVSGPYNAMPIQGGCDMYDTHVKRVVEVPTCCMETAIRTQNIDQKVLYSREDYLENQIDTQANLAHENLPGIREGRISTDETSLGINIRLLQDRINEQSVPTANTNIDKQKLVEEPLPQPKSTEDAPLSDPDLRFPPNITFPRLPPLSPTPTDTPIPQVYKNTPSRQTSSSTMTRSYGMCSRGNSGLDFHKRLEAHVESLQKSKAGCKVEPVLSTSSSGYDSVNGNALAQGIKRLPNSEEASAFDVNSRSASEHDDREKRCCCESQCLCSTSRGPLDNLDKNHRGNK